MDAYEEIEVAPPNALIIIHGYSDPEIPQSMGQGAMSATGSCVAVGVQHPADGTTVLRMGVDLPNPPPIERAILLYIDLDHVRIESVTGDIYLKHPVDMTEMVIRIFTNHESEPDEVHVDLSH